MAEEKESKVTQEDKLQTSFDSISEKLDTSLSDINTRLDSFETKFDDFKVPEPTSLAPQTESYVPKGWAPTTEGGWNDVFNETSKIAKETAATAASTAINAYKDEVSQETNDRQAEEDRINKNFDAQIIELEKAGRIPKVENPDDDKDKGVVAQKEIFQFGVDYASTDLIKMANLRDKIKAVPPKGIEAPVGSSMKTTEAVKSLDYDKDIRGKTMDTMIQEEFPR